MESIYKPPLQKALAVLHNSVLKLVLKLMWVFQAYGSVLRHFGLFLTNRNQKAKAKRSQRSKTRNRSGFPAQSIEICFLKHHINLHDT